MTIPEDAQAIIKPWDQRNDTSQYAESGVDDQVRSTRSEFGCALTLQGLQFIIHVPFTQNVRVKSVLVKLGESPGLFQWTILRGTA